MTTETHPPTCPVAHGRAFNPLDPGQAGDPYPWLRAAQAACPVFYMPEQNMWCVTRYADVVQVLRDTETYSSRKVIRLAQLDADLLDAFPDGPPDEVLVSTDPPKHTRLRALAQTAFTPKLVNEREDEIRALCHRLIDGFVDRGRCDLAADFAEKLPVQAITRLVGAPLEKSEDFYQWGIDRVTLLLGAPRLDERQRAELSRRVVAMSTWLREFVEERRENPRDDLASALVHATTDEGFPVLSTPETVTMIGTILSAGSSTTAHFLPLMVRELLSHPGQWAQVVTDRGVLKRAVEEVLRYRTSVHGVTRTTTRPVTLGEWTCPRAPTSTSTTRRRNATPRSSTTPTPWMCIARTSSGTSRSAGASTPASARPWRGWRREWRWNASSTGCRACAWRPTRRPNAGSRACSPPGWNGLTWNGTRSAPRRREVTMTTTMPALDIDPFIDDVLAEPTDFHRRLRAAGPAVKVRQSEGLDLVAVGRDRDVREIYADHENFLNSRGSGVLDLKRDEPFREPGLLLEHDPPARTAVRTVMADVISPRHVRGLRASLQAAADDLVDRLLTWRPSTRGRSSPRPSRSGSFRTRSWERPRRDERTCCATASSCSSRWGRAPRAPAASRSNCLMWRERSPGVRDGTPVPLLNNTLRGWSSLPVTITAA
ncbi:hypothetical protein LUW76_05545 [Actinomadura madurae]|nr:cytochrome P450 [Actinomadura madurae]URM93827.1 hypothetical protein LUW76_05545 [Actinomadura madurae]